MALGLRIPHAFNRQRLVRLAFARSQARGCAYESASEALITAARHPSQETFRRCVAAIESVPEGDFWLRFAAEEEEMQLQRLSSSLPKGVRLVPGLLEHVLPSEVPPTIEVVQLLPRILGAREGLSTVLSWREAARRAAQSGGAEMVAERLERRLDAVLALWFHEGFLRTTEIDTGTKAEAAKAAEAAETRCFALSFPQMAEGPALAPPLATLHAVLRDSEAEMREPQLCEAVLTGYGLEHLLLQQTKTQLREQGFKEISATVNLRGFRHWLRSSSVLTQRPHFSQEVRAILAASCGSNSSLRFTDASGDDVAFSVPEQGQRGLEAGGVCYAILLGKRMNNQWTWGTLPFVGHKHMRQLRGLTLRSKVWLSFLVSPCGAKVEVSINGADAKHVRRIKLQEDPAAVLVSLEEGAMQIDLPEEVELLKLEKLCAFGGLLTPKMRQPVLQLAFEYLFWPGEGRATHPDVDFHLSRGADFVSLHWRAEESPEALASSFGLLATFNYKQDSEQKRANDYTQNGVRTIVE
ncbi:unnamed protein product [Cladocopium goreaui]|uniref:Malonyl-CoA decarboxylase C-terminal domain-containing protein n=1 Tax=Cladocopium goreaui TaxID=2562237 RepID=A0A9P1BJC9_9DINO|nr:unnamed protein product [Cladocopium goreaui]